MRKYKNLLYTFSLHQRITKAARKNALIDHISSIMNNKLLHKLLRNEKDLNMNDYVADFKLPPTSTVFGFDDPNDQIAMLNKLITDCIADHALIKKVKFALLPALLMKDP